MRGEGESRILSPPRRCIPRRSIDSASSPLTGSRANPIRALIASRAINDTCSLPALSAGLARGAGDSCLIVPRNTRTAITRARMRASARHATITPRGGVIGTHTHRHCRGTTRTLPPSLCLSLSLSLSNRVITGIASARVCTRPLN